MLTYLKGNMFSSPAQVLVNTVNTVGVMGKGVALEFKKRYPEMFKSYERACNEKLLEIGKLLLWKGPDKWVLMFPTKKHWRSPSKLEYVEAGLKKFISTYVEKKITSIAFPRLGCGNGGLDWEDVRPLMEKYLKQISIPIYIYVGNYPDQIPEHMIPDPIEQWLHSKRENIGFSILQEDLERKFSQKIQFTLLDGTVETAKWDGTDLLITNENPVRISSKELCRFWVYIRDCGVISLDKLPQEFLSHAEILLKVLEHLSYLQPVLASSNGIDFQSGYQYIHTMG